jgi:hypothetical protein
VHNGTLLADVLLHRAHLPSTMGLGTVLKNMKKKQYVDYQDDFIKDPTLITLIHSFDEAIVSQVVLYHEIGDKVTPQLNATLCSMTLTVT